jgi:hypothetical protein
LPPYSSSKTDPEDLVVAEELGDVRRELGALVGLGARGAIRSRASSTHEVTDLALLVGQRIVRHAESV